MSGGYANPYRLRKQLPEPVFGQKKIARRSTALRMGARLHRAQSPQADPREESVCSEENDRGTGLGAGLRPAIDGLDVACRALSPA